MKNMKADIMNMANGKVASKMQHFYNSYEKLSLTHAIIDVFPTGTNNYSHLPLPSNNSKNDAF